jgi:hypothetical protein
MRFVLTLFVFMCFASVALSQSWSKKEREISEPPLQLFHSTYAYALPTAETLSKGDYLYGISHRFTVPVSSGFDQLFGIDGPVINMMNFGYGITDDLFINLGRSNHEAQWWFETKYKTFKFRDENFPLLVSFLGGVAYTSRPVPVPDFERSGRDWHFYGVAIINTLINHKLGLGITPTFMYNSYLQCPEVKNSVTLGACAEYYIDDMYSILVEANPTVYGWRNKYDSYAVGFSMETGGHFFKFSVSNNAFINIQQYNTGATDAFLGSENNNGLHFGFQITRNL